MAAAGATWAQVRQQARAAETQVGGTGLDAAQLPILTKPLDRVALPHICTVRRKVRCGSEADRRGTEDRRAVD